MEFAEVANWLIASYAGFARCGEKTGRPNCCGAGKLTPRDAAFWVVRTTGGRRFVLLVRPKWTPWTYWYSPLSVVWSGNTCSILNDATSLYGLWSPG